VGGGGEEGEEGEKGNKAKWKRIGVDVAVDARCHVWMIEFNSNPGMRAARGKCGAPKRDLVQRFYKDESRPKNWRDPSQQDRCALQSEFAPNTSSERKLAPRERTHAPCERQARETGASVESRVDVLTRLHAHMHATTHIHTHIPSLGPSDWEEDEKEEKKEMEILLARCVLVEDDVSAVCSSEHHTFGFRRLQVQGWL